MPKVLNLLKYVPWVRTVIANGQEQYGKRLLERINANTPEKTRVLIKNNKLETNRWELKARVYNPTFYARFVEFGVMWRVYNYHKAGTVFYVWVWAWMFRRWFDQTRSLYKKFVENGLSQLLK